MEKKIHNYHKREMLYMAKKQGTTKEVKVMEGEGKDAKEIVYVLEHPGYLESTRIKDRIKTANGGISEEKWAKELMEHVIVNPKTSFAYWEEHEGFNEVLEAAGTFLLG